MSHGAAGYTAAKHGVVGLMRHFATSLAEKNIRVNSVHPGDVSETMVYLCGPAGRHLTGVALPLDAGLTLK